MSNLDGRNFGDVYSINLQTGERKLALKQSRWTYAASPDGTYFAYYNDGQYYVQNLATGESTNITKGIAATSFINTEDDHNIVKPPTPFIGWSKDSKSVLLSDNWDIWQVRFPVRATNLTVRARKIRSGTVVPSFLIPEDRGYDLTKKLYLDAYGEWTKKSGIAVIEPGKPA